MITSLDQARGVILQWYDEVSINEHEASVETLPMLIGQACDFIAEETNSSIDLRQQAAIRVLFADLIEAWNDSFSMSGRNAYAAIFGRIVWTAASLNEDLQKGLAQFNIHSVDDLVARHQRIRSTKHFTPPADCDKIVVLSRVTIGADILLTSVLVKRLQQRYPNAHITIIGDKKLHGLFGSLKQVSIQSLSYARRGTLNTRLLSWLDLTAAISAIDPQFVIAPDSRLDQLGMLPVCDEQKYLLWENLQISKKAESLSVLLDEWTCEQFGLDAEPEIFPELAFSPETQSIADHMRGVLLDRPFIAVKLDYGGNQAKAVEREWEIEILRCMIDRGWRILIDRGFGDEELKNSDAIMRGIGFTAFDISENDEANGTLLKNLKAQDIEDHSIIRFYGSIAAWAACTKSCQLAFSYDSVGHHLAAALGIPLVIAFTGYADKDFPTAWQPRGPGEVNMVCIPENQKKNRSYLTKILDHIAKLTTRIQKA